MKSRNFAKITIGGKWKFVLKWAILMIHHLNKKEYFDKIDKSIAQTRTESWNQFQKMPKNFGFMSYSIEITPEALLDIEKHKIWW